MYVPVPDDELIELMRSNNEVATELLLKRYDKFFSIWVDKIFFSMRSERDDALQVARLTFLDCIERYQPAKGQFYSFVNLCITQRLQSYSNARYEWNKVAGYYSLDDPEVRYQAENTTHHIDDINDRLISDERVNRVLESKFLDGEEKEIFKLRIAGFHYNEIAERLNIKRKDVDNTLYKIRKIFKKKVSTK